MTLSSQFTKGLLLLKELEHRNEDIRTHLGEEHET